jgi:signal peptidase II
VGNNVVFTALSIIASLGVLIYLFAHKDEGVLMKSSLALILGGAVGNLIDRILFKRVADFIDVGIGDLRWPVFNVADSAVVVGMVILFFTMYKSGKKEKESTPEGAREIG